MSRGYFWGMHLIGVYLIGICLIGVYLIVIANVRFESQYVVYLTDCRYVKLLKMKKQEKLSKSPNTRRHHVIQHVTTK